MGNVATKTLCKKYGLTTLIRPYLPLDEELGWLFEKLPTIPIRELTEEDVLQPKDERYLDLRVDLTEEEEELTKAFNEIIRYYKPNSERTRCKDAAFDKWEIWDLHYLSALSLVEIARRKSGKEYHPGQEKSPNYNPELAALYKQVQRAYRQAVNMIKIVEGMILGPQRFRATTKVTVVSTSPEDLP